MKNYTRNCRAVEAGTQTGRDFFSRFVMDRGVNVREKGDNCPFQEIITRNNYLSPSLCEKMRCGPSVVISEQVNVFFPSPAGSKSLHTIKEINFPDLHEEFSNEVTAASYALSSIYEGPTLVQSDTEYGTAQSLSETDADDHLLRSLHTAPLTLDKSPLFQILEKAKQDKQLSTKDFEQITNSLMNEARVSTKYACLIFQKLSGILPAEDVCKLREKVLSRVIPGNSRQIPTKFIQNAIDQFLS